MYLNYCLSTYLSPLVQSTGLLYVIAFEIIEDIPHALFMILLLHKRELWKNQSLSQFSL